jgi:hypothetical protein
MRHLILILLVGIVPSIASAQSCAANSPSSNLTTGAGSLAQLPAMDQGGTGLCYAFTISQLADAYRYRTPANRTRRISPLALGMLTPQSSNFLQRSRLDDGGSPSAALQALNNPSNPKCDYAYLRRLYGSTDDQFSLFGTMELMFKQIREAYYTPCSCTAASRRQDALGDIRQMRAYMTGPSLLEGQPSQGTVNSLLADLGAIIVRMNDLPPSAFANYNTSFNGQLLVPYFNRLCRGNTITTPTLRLTGIRRSSYDFNNQLSAVAETGALGRFSNHAWDILSRPGAQPVGISFCSRMLTGASAFISPASSQCDNHAAVLAGQRCRGGRRQFLLRNSWGNDCGQVAARHRPNCDGRGNVWVDGENLMRSAYSLYQTVP